MSKTTETPAPPAPAAPAPAAPAHRPADAIAAELAEATARFLAMEKENHAYRLRRDRAVVRREKLMAAWAKESPDEPFDETAYNPPATIPPPGSPESREFHKIHYTIGRLGAELEAAKKASVS